MILKEFFYFAISVIMISFISIMDITMHINIIKSAHTGIGESTDSKIFVDTVVSTLQEME